jgi:hypothetical protein
MLVSSVWSIERILVADCAIVKVNKMLVGRHASSPLLVLSWMYRSSGPDGGARLLRAWHLVNGPDSLARMVGRLVSVLDGLAADCAAATRSWRGAEEDLNC